MDRVILDSNIYISALQFGGKPAQLLQLAIDGEVHVTISDAITEEVVGVLRDKFGATPEELIDVLGLLSSCTSRVHPKLKVDIIETDTDDNRVLECAVEAAADYVVTGDNDLLRLGDYEGIRILRVSEFLERYGP